MTPKKWKFRKTLAQRAFPYVKLRLLSYRAYKSVHGYGLYAWLGKKKQTKRIIKGTRPRYFTTMWGRHRWYDCWSAWRYHPCQIWKPTIYNCDFDKRLNLTILALLGPSPLTRQSLAGLPVISDVFEVQTAADYHTGTEKFEFLYFYTLKSSDSGMKVWWCNKLYPAHFFWWTSETIRL